MNILEKIKEWGDFLGDSMMHITLYDDGSGALYNGWNDRVYEWMSLEKFLESVPTKDKEDE